MKSNAKKMLLAGGLVVGAGVALAGMSATAREGAQRAAGARPAAQKMAEGAAPKANVGGKVAAFTLKNADGADVPVSWDAGDTKATVLVFVSVQCPVSNAYNERLAALAKAYAGKGVQMYGLNANAPEKAADIKDHAARQGWSFPVLLDAGNKVADQLGASVTPEAYVVDRAGVLVYAGRVDDAQNAAEVQSRDLAAAVDAVLGGQTVAKSKTAAFGCSIKRAG